MLQRGGGRPDDEENGAREELYTAHGGLSVKDSDGVGPILDLLLEAALALKKKGELDDTAEAPMVVVPYFAVNEKGVIVKKNRPIME